ncbi:MAG TPA: protein phosphatase 2C domain-containing protein [Terriglobia bacterium]
MLDVEFAELTDVGRVRDNNEDYLDHVLPATPEAARSHGWLFALADGVGGQERGEVASRAAVDSVLSGFRKAPGGEPPAALLQRLVQAANARVYELGLASGGGDATMATTLVACALRFDRAVVAHVGDSRCCLVRSARVTVLTRDHTVAGEHERLGLLSAREAAEVPTRHLLTRSLGNDLFVGVETSDHQLLSGDILVLCSDGLHDAVTAVEMAHIIGHSLDLKTAAERLVEAANQRDGGDNVSVQLIRVRGVERMGMYRGRPYRLR